MKNTFLYFLIGALIVSWFWFYFKINSMSKTTSTKTNGNRLFNFNRQGVDTTIVETPTEPTILKEVTAERLVEALREKLNADQIKSLDITFN